MYKNTKITARGQTQIDFVIGISIFLLSMALVFTGTTQLFTTFGTTNPSITISDNSADILTKNILTTQETPPYTLDRKCTETFFELYSNDTVTDSEINQCQFSTNSTLKSQLSIQPKYYVNITIENSTTILENNGTQYSVGSIPEDTDTTVSRRLIRIDDTRYYAYVRVAN